MKFAELTPEEKLYCAIFLEPSGIEGIHHWLSPEGKEAIQEALNKYQTKHGPRGVKVLRLRFGFEPLTAEEKAKRRSPPESDARSFQEVGIYLDVTRERIRQIEIKTLRALRHPVYSSSLLKQSKTIPSMLDTRKGMPKSIEYGMTYWLTDEDYYDINTEMCRIAWRYIPVLELKAENDQRHADLAHAELLLKKHGIKLPGGDV